jgi:Flp pilus assembly protein TadB
MNESELDRQLADMIWCISTALRAGYSMPQILKQLAEIAPEPTASACARIHNDLKQGISVDQALENWLEAVNSAYLGTLVSTIQKQRELGGNLPDILDPVCESILEATGSDGAFFPVMRDLAQSVGARLPSRALSC